MYSERTAMGKMHLWINTASFKWVEHGFKENDYWMLLLENGRLCIRAMQSQTKHRSFAHNVREIWACQTFEVDNKPSTCEARASSLEHHQSAAYWQVNHLLAQRTTLTERLHDVPLAGGYTSPIRHTDVVVAATSTSHVQLKVEQRQPDCLRRLNDHRPPALGVHIIPVWQSVAAVK